VHSNLCIVLPVCHPHFLLLAQNCNVSHRVLAVWLMFSLCSMSYVSTIKLTVATYFTLTYFQSTEIFCIDIIYGMRELGVEEWLVSADMSIYTGAKTVIRTVYGNSKCFEIKVGMHQGSALSPLLFVMVMEALSREFRVALAWDFLYAGDLFVIAETEDNLIKKLNEWKSNMENRGMTVNISSIDKCRISEANAGGCKMAMVVV